MTSQCSASWLFSRRTMSTTIQFTGRPMPLNRPWEQHVVAIGDGEPVLVAEIFWNSLDQGEKPLASGRNVGGVLNVVRRPETLRGRVVPLVEKGFEGFQHEGLILFLDRLRHLILLRNSRRRFPAGRLDQLRFTMSITIVF